MHIFMAMIVSILHKLHNILFNICSHFSLSINSFNLKLLLTDSDKLTFCIFCSLGCRFRKWLRSLLRDSGGPFFDVFRSKHPERYSWLIVNCSSCSSDIRKNKKYVIS